MKVLVVGSGGREHTIVWKLDQSAEVKKIFCAPGNGGITQIAECVPIGVMEFDKLATFAEENRIDLTVIGPEDPLCAGIVDEFEGRGLRVFGPNKQAAQIEGSKIFAKHIMQKYDIPTAEHAEFDNSAKAIKYLHRVGAPIVVKAYGNAMGKGVSVCHTAEEAEAFVRKCLDEKAFGAAGSRIIIEECLFGEEASLLAFTDGKTVLPMDSAQDHKPVYDGDKGPNTGGMGAYSPAPVVTNEMYQHICDEILAPAVRGLASEGIDYRGVLYAGVMITDSGPKVLEFNARFGDPENQALMPRLETDLVEVMDAVIDQRLDSIELKWTQKSAVCVVMASGGYPVSYEKGKVIEGLDAAARIPGTIVFHAGTNIQDNSIVTSGGRVLGVTSLADTLEGAIASAYNAVGKITFEKAHYREDIGAKALIRLKG
jgi:phosphoribosylamine--glycine ligase